MRVVTLRHSHAHKSHVDDMYTQGEQAGPKVRRAMKVQIAARGCMIARGQ